MAWKDFSVQQSTHIHLHIEQKFVCHMDSTISLFLSRGIGWRRIGRGRLHPKWRWLPILRPICWLCAKLRPVLLPILRWLLNAVLLTHGLVVVCANNSHRSTCKGNTFDLLMAKRGFEHLYVMAILKVCHKLCPNLTII